jgi:hypothetical protein
MTDGPTKPTTLVRWSAPVGGFQWITHSVNVKRDSAAAVF